MAKIQITDLALAARWAARAVMGLREAAMPVRASIDWRASQPNPPPAFWRSWRRLREALREFMAGAEGLKDSLTGYSRAGEALSGSCKSRLRASLLRGRGSG